MEQQSILLFSVSHHHVRYSIETFLHSPDTKIQVLHVCNWKPILIWDEVHTIQQELRSLVHLRHRQNKCFYV